jgi:hypothetical protein
MCCKSAEPEKLGEQEALEEDEELRLVRRTSNGATYTILFWESLLIMKLQFYCKENAKGSKGQNVETSTQRWRTPADLVFCETR